MVLGIGSRYERVVNDTSLVLLKSGGNIMVRAEQKIHSYNSNAPRLLESHKGHLLSYSLYEANLPIRNAQRPTTPSSFRRARAIPPQSSQHRDSHTLTPNSYILIEPPIPILAPRVLLIRHPDDVLVISAHPFQATHMLLVSRDDLDLLPLVQALCCGNHCIRW
jgi:hypothetical protein